eukprot:CAMPEP_0185019768 /NCGR_PEP_ID=MMETSP1103-20130426/2351_1 /TAXON_ID=36769 /ORGANISM="Paraphysomonas bandaiensis, Strain Caron Lab Isolate" /LENGTH=471 /DNA_ID=CAMNT_0027550241 /DNA_START=367 /DNA_END=1779 /DNA_ORIENTATION=+
MTVQLSGTPTSPARKSISKPEASKQPSDFYFGRCLGEGAYARVVHAKLKKNNHEFAVKIMEKRHIKKENKVKYVMMEKSILSKLNNPFIVRLYYTFQDSGYLYMCMDLAHGGELRSYISSQREKNKSRGISDVACDAATAQFYFAEIVEAVDYLHSHNIIHRDLKPENILITSKGHLKVTDFGTAAMNEGGDEDMRTSFVGTAEYVSPEVLQNENATRACDIWALGCILFNMLVGRTPFHSPSEYLTFQAIIRHCEGEEPVQYPDTIHEESRELIEGFLLPAPGDRMGSGAAGTENDLSIVKSHRFFSGIDWSGLKEKTPPYVPDPATFPSADNMQDGANDDWLFEGEATPILMRSYGSQDGVEVGTAEPPSPDNKDRWRVFLQDNEEQVFAGLIWKRKGLFSKHRMMILTDRPRLIYIDPATMVLKGEIPWDTQHPVKCNALSAHAFDILSTLTGRVYHITDSDAGSQIW